MHSTCSSADLWSFKSWQLQATVIWMRVRHSLAITRAQCGYRVPAKFNSLSSFLGDMFTEERVTNKHVPKIQVPRGKTGTVCLAQTL